MCFRRFVSAILILMSIPVLPIRSATLAPPLARKKPTNIVTHGDSRVDD
ncbi:MAG: hypothetical protein JWM99_1846, partial [Verrucomicrobiales bacterium]|nr:hypothetical protein [Verrucomicrobiales bacterium]